MVIKYLVVVIVMFCSINLVGQEYYKAEKNIIILDNGSVRREISTEGNRFCSSAMLMAGMKENIIGDSREFSFSLNDKILDGRSGWKIISSSPVSDLMQGKGVKIILEPENSSEFRIELNYLTYPELPVIRKWISFQNTGSEELKIENLNIEDLGPRINYVHAMIYHNYARMKHIGPFVGNWDDPVVVIHDPGIRRGIAIGNEAPGVLKRTAFHTKGNNLEAGLTHTDQGVAFRKWLKPGEKWESPKTFICLYQGTDNGFDVINGDVNKFIVRHMNTRIVSADEKPVFVYNTWNPFRTFVSDSLVRDVARAAAECGVQEFIIDDGWQVNEKSESSDAGWGKNYGDWNVDEKKFPGGLKPTFDYIKSLGMKPGLWISIGSATPDAKVYKEHPEWFVKSEDGQPGNLHQGSANKDFVTFCFGTGWVDYIKNKVLSLVNDYGLAYAKLDFAVITSAYVNDDAISGCYATDHPFHKDHHESFIVIYERLFKLFDELHKSAPDLFIDCTFETAGKLQLMDYAIAQHAEGNWLSNVEQPFPAGPLRVRHLAWWRSPAVPASSLVIGNLQMNEETFEFSLKSLIGSLPIVLGDPRKIPSGKRAVIKQWSTWMQEMQLKYDYMSYRKDLPGFGEPAEGMWDGWMRLNTDTKAGGIIGVFRQGASDEKRTVTLKDLISDKIYSIRLAPDGKEIISASGKELIEKGFEVTLPDKYDGKIYEVTIK
jgi:alpha-galactosidase